MASQSPAQKCPAAARASGRTPAGTGSGCVRHRTASCAVQPSPRAHLKLVAVRARDILGANDGVCWGGNAASNEDCSRRERRRRAAASRCRRTSVLMRVSMGLPVSRASSRGDASATPAAVGAVEAILELTSGVKRSIPITSLRCCVPLWCVPCAGAVPPWVCGLARVHAAMM